MAEGGLADPLLLDLAREAEEDPTYQDMVEAVRLNDKLQDFPKNHPLRQFKKLMEGMFLYDLPSGTLLCSHDGRFVIPSAARKRYVELLHQSHMAGRTMVDTARRSFFWPGLIQDIIQFYENYQV